MRWWASLFNKQRTCSCAVDASSASAPTSKCRRAALMNRWWVLEVFNVSPSHTHSDVCKDYFRYMYLLWAQMEGKFLWLDLLTGMSCLITHTFHSSVRLYYICLGCRFCKFCLETFEDSLIHCTLQVCSIDCMRSNFHCGWWWCFFWPLCAEGEEVHLLTICHFMFGWRDGILRVE